MSPAAAAFQQELVRLIDRHQLLPRDLGDPAVFGRLAATLAVQEMLRQVSEGRITMRPVPEQLR